MTQVGPLRQLPGDVPAVLADFRHTHGREAWLWTRTGGEWSIAVGDAPPGRLAPGPLSAPVLHPGEPEWCVEVEEGPGADGAEVARFLASILQRVLRHDEETRLIGRELSERYEEITLLYGISEILGAVISLEEAAGTILSEVAGTLAVQRAALWVHDPEKASLELVAAVGEPGQPGPISVDDPSSVTATVFRERRPVILEPGATFPRREWNPAASREASFLSVPVSYTPPVGESRTIGVINLVGRGADESFSAGDQKLIAAIASQIGAAVENSRLVAQSVRRERLDREMELAHDLQLKLLPSPEQFVGVAEVAARCIPAESVGGDFYHLFRLSGDRVGVMIGDVSSHGFGAALIMALTMSAVGIHAAEVDTPAEVLRRTHRAIISELETTEMYVTLFYGVVDPRRGTLTYANAGHSHAFLVSADGGPRRLAVTNPPLGIVDLDDYREERHPWSSGADLLFLFTDGLSDALGRGEVEGARVLVDLVARYRDEPLPELLERVYAAEPQESDLPADDRTAVLVRV